MHRGGIRSNKDEGSSAVGVTEFNSVHFRDRFSKHASDPFLVVVLDGPSNSPKSAALVEAIMTAKQQCDEEVVDMPYYYSYKDSTYDGLNNQMRAYVGADAESIVCIIFIGETFHLQLLNPETSSSTLQGTLVEMCHLFKVGSLNKQILSAPRPLNDADSNQGELGVVVADSFEQLVLQSGREVLLYMHAGEGGLPSARSSSCALVRSIGTIVYDLAKTFHGENGKGVLVARLDCASNDVNSIGLGCHSPPTLLYFTGQDSNRQGEPLFISSSEVIREGLYERGVRWLKSMHRISQVGFDLGAAISSYGDVVAARERSELKRIVRALSDEHFSNILFRLRRESVIVMWHAAWSPPSQTVLPLYANLSDSETHCSFVSVDVDSCPQSSAAMSISTLPTFHLVKNGKYVAKVEGADMQALRDMCAYTFESPGNINPEPRVQQTSMLCSLEMDGYNSENDGDEPNILHRGITMAVF